MLSSRLDSRAVTDILHPATGLSRRRKVDDPVVTPLQTGGLTL